MFMSTCFNVVIGMSALVSTKRIFSERKYALHPHRISLVFAYSLFSNRIGFRYEFCLVNLIKNDDQT